MTKPMRVFQSGLTGRFYATDNYHEVGVGQFQAITKMDVTSDVQAIVEASWPDWAWTIAQWAKAWEDGERRSLDFAGQEVPKVVQDLLEHGARNLHMEVDHD